MVREMSQTRRRAGERWRAATRSLKSKSRRRAGTDSGARTPPNATVLVCGLVAWLLVGCSVEIRGGVFSCSSDSECPARFQCVAQRCYREGNAPDGGMPADAAADSSGTQFDFGWLDGNAHGDSGPPDSDVVDMDGGGSVDQGGGACMVDNGGCDPLVTCTVAFGGTVCGSCPPGYSDDRGDGSSCTDIDECQDGWNGGCDHTCTNDAGGYHCSCRDGWELAANVKACADIDECAEDNGQCGDADYVECTNMVGGPPSCTDIDECRLNNGECGDPAFWICQNESGAPPTCTRANGCAPGYAPVGGGNCERCTASEYCAGGSAGPVVCPVYVPTHNPAATCSHFVEVSAGVGHTCALDTTGEVSCWGGNNYGEATVPAGLGHIVQVVASRLATCVLDATGHVTCWGLSGGTTAVPSNLGTVQQIASGQGHSCALDTEGAVRCWGDDAHGQVSVPTDLRAVVYLAGGRYNSCAIDDLSVPRCWGWNANNQTVTPATTGAPVQVAVGSGFVCVLDDLGLLTCWGYSVDGQTSVPQGVGQVAQVDAGNFHVCAINEAGAATCWGRGTYGATNVPSDLGVVRRISAGGSHTCAVTSAGAVRCWGDNAAGQTDVPMP